MNYKHLLPIFFLFCLNSLPAQAQRIYVDATATGDNNGSSWADAFTGLQGALAAAAEGDQVWVAQGIYLPAAPGGSRSASFVLDKNLKLYGGFAGTESSLEERGNPANHPTILSGDLNGDDVEEDFATNRGDNVLHVVTITNAVGNETLMDGFTVRGGHAGGSSAPDSFGGGIFSEGTPAIRNGVFTQNFCNDLGGAIIFINTPAGAAAVVEGCEFIQNKANAGGAVCLRFSSADFDNCHFVSNQAKDEGAAPFEENGGAIQTRNSNMALNNCSFRGNTCNGIGGSFSFFVDPDGEGFAFEMDSCLLEGNLAEGYGGAIFSQSWGKGTSVTLANSQFIANHGLFGNVNIYNQQNGAYGNVWIDNCLFEDNTSASAAGAISMGSGPGAEPSEYTIANCIFRDNIAETIGGALELWSEVNTVARFLLENCRFEGNLAGSEAGAVWIDTGSDGFEASASHCEFIGNESPAGAAIASNPSDLVTPSVPVEAKFTMDNCLASGNAGGNILSLLSFPDFMLLNCTLAGNAGGIQLGSQSGLTLQNTILYNPGFTEFEVLSEDASTSSNGGNLIGDGSLEGWLNNTDHQAADPMLDANYRLMQGSPAVDAGVAYEGMPELDLAGNQRVQGNGVDIGAYESSFVSGGREALAEAPLALAPNPAGAFLRVELPSTAQQPFHAQVMDAQGKLAAQAQLRNGGLLNVEGLPRGMYLVKASVDGVVYTGRFVKQ